MEKEMVDLLREHYDVVELASGGPGVAIGQESAAHMSEPDMPLDTDGRTFDPNFHLSETDGRPKTRNGKLVKRRRRKPATDETESGNDQGNQPAAGAGIAAAQLTFALATIYGGPVWQPQAMELRAMTDAWAGVFAYYGVEEIHPAVTLVCVVAAYAQPRLAKADTASRIKGWWQRWRNRRKHGAQADNWDNGFGQVYSGEPDFAGVQSGRAQGSNS